tara:strand:+ start:2056 stop:2244 length:189 start_codon:yes stop_codon:yes gene_type:complete
MNDKYRVKRDKTHSTSRGVEKAYKKASKAEDRRFDKKVIEEEMWPDNPAEVDCFGSLRWRRK